MFERFFKTTETEEDILTKERKKTEAEFNIIKRWFPIRAQRLLDCGTPLIQAMPTCSGVGPIIHTGVTNIDFNIHGKQVLELKEEIVGKIWNSYNFENDTAIAYYAGQNIVNSGEVFTMGYPINIVKTISSAQNMPYVPTSYSSSINQLVKIYSQAFSEIFETAINAKVCIAVGFSLMEGAWLEGVGYTIHAARSVFNRVLQEYGNDLLRDSHERVLIISTEEAIEQCGLDVNKFEKIDRDKYIEDAAYEDLHYIGSDIYVNFSKSV